MFRWDFLRGFSLYIINFAGRIGDATIGRAGGVQRPVLHVNEPKKTGASSARAQPQPFSFK
jgi:hypothetical protein